MSDATAVPDRYSKPERQTSHAPITAGTAAAKGLVAEVACRTCRRVREIPIATLNLPPDAPLLDTLRRRLKCRGCGAKGYLVITAWGSPRGRSLFWRPVIELLVDNTACHAPNSPNRGS